MARAGVRGYSEEPALQARVARAAARQSVLVDKLLREKESYPAFLVHD
jgi:hypothetical protein